MTERIKKIRKFVNAQSLYMWLIIFILIVNSASMFMDVAEEPILEKKARVVSSVEDMAKKKLAAQTKLMENENLMVFVGVVSLLIVLFICIGLVLDLAILMLKMNKKEPILRSFKFSQIRWTLWDVIKVIILFLFFGYILALIETILTHQFPVIKDQKTLVSTINTTILDILGVLFVLYFAIMQYKHKLINLGLTFRNFFRNILYGVTGYIATIPVLVLVLIIVLWIITLFKYQPPPQQVLELFMEEKKISALIYMSFFVGILGPIAEEIFFRGFMYNAIKKEMGIKWALVLSSSLFAFMHAHLVGFLPIMMLGLLLAYLYEKTGSLIASITVHIIHNTAMVFFVFLLKELYL